MSSLMLVLVLVAVVGLIESFAARRRRRERDE
jgi:ABC-type phosphate/phosphonate transport system permease subunit